jgi:hypothetical protein
MPEEVAILGLTTIISSTIVILYGIRAWSVRGRAKGAAEIPRQVDQRLERIEQAVDAIAIEVERISEGQRFTTKLLADRAAEPQASRRLS